MDMIIPQSQLGARIRGIGTTPSALAAKAGVYHTTLMRVIHGGNCNLDTMKSISDALRAEELRMLKYLLQLYPDRALHEGLVHNAPAA